MHDYITCIHLANDMQGTSYHTALYEKNMEIIELREQHNMLLVNR